MEREFFLPSVEDTQVVLVDHAILKSAQERIRACEACAPEDAVFSLTVLLDELTGCDPYFTEYLLPQALWCPHCTSSITEDTRVVWEPDDGSTTLVPAPLHGSRI